MKLQTFYTKHWDAYPLEIQGVVQHLQSPFPEGAAGKKVLDGGSGSGMISVGFAILGADVTGVDITEECVENGKRNAARFGVSCRFLRGDLTCLDLGETFDIVYCWGVIHHSADARKSFETLARHTKKGGEIVLAVYLKTALSRFWNFSRIFYRGSPGFLRAVYRSVGSFFLNVVDLFERVVLKRSRYMMRGTRNAELIDDWFGVPRRSFHTYEEAAGWFEENGCDHRLVNRATGRFRSTSNFVVRGRKLGAEAAGVPADAPSEPHCV